MVLWTLPRPGQAIVTADMQFGTTSGATTETQTASSTPHEKGAWNEWVASTSAEWAGFWLFVRSGAASSTIDTSMLLDVGIGGAGSEVVILPDFPYGYTDNTRSGDVFVPLRVPAGVRVAARIQAAVASDTLGLVVMPVTGRGFTSDTYQVATAYGADAATSRGVTVTADTGTNNTFGSWTEIVASTSGPVRAMLAGVQFAGDADVGSSNWRLEVGFGAAGSEVVLSEIGATAASTESMAGSGNSWLRPPAGLGFTTTIPEGARLAARLMTATSTTTTPSVDVVLIGLR